MSDNLKFDELELDEALLDGISELDPNVITCGQHPEGIGISYDKTKYGVCPLCAKTKEAKKLFDALLVVKNYLKLSIEECEEIKS